MSHNIESQVSGTVWKVEKPTGQPVTEGEVILIVESMKMEVPHEAVGAGTVFVPVRAAVTESHQLAMRHLAASERPQGGSVPPAANIATLDEPTQ